MQSFVFSLAVGADVRCCMQPSAAQVPSKDAASSMSSWFSKEAPWQVARYEAEVVDGCIMSL